MRDHRPPPTRENAYNLGTYHADRPALGRSEFFDRFNPPLDVGRRYEGLTALELHTVYLEARKRHRFPQEIRQVPELRSDV